MAQRLEALRQIFRYGAKCKNFSRVLDKIDVVEAGDGRVVCELTVGEEHENPQGTLHGGFSATMIDQVTTMACMTSERGEPGVSVNLNVNFIRAAPRGEKLRIEGIVQRVGHHIAFTTGEVRRKSDNELVAHGTHSKAFPPKMNLDESPE